METRMTMGRPACRPTSAGDDAPGTAQAKVSSITAARADIRDHACMPAIIAGPAIARSRWSVLAALVFAAACQSSPPLPTDTTNVAMLALVAGSLDDPLFVTAPPAD